jgi:hypothetical protein
MLIPKIPVDHHLLYSIAFKGLLISFNHPVREEGVKIAHSVSFSIKFLQMLLSVQILLLFKLFIVLYILKVTVSYVTEYTILVGMTAA